MNDAENENTHKPVGDRMVNICIVYTAYGTNIYLKNRIFKKKVRSAAINNEKVLSISCGGKKSKVLKMCLFEMNLDT